MMALQFCTDSINILMRHSCKGVIEIKRLDLILIEDIKTSVETAISLLLEDLNEDTFINFVRLVGLSPCERLLKHLGYEDIETKTTAPEAALGLLRKTVLLLDMALISYVRSHGSGFDTPGLGSEVKFVEVSEGEDSFAFKCSWMKLTCLAAFLDERQVWVFEFLNPSPVESHLEQDITPRPTSVLTRMRDLADIWGPVYTVPNASGLVKHYVVSNGVICRVNTKQQCTAPGAVQCHYYSRPSFLRRKAYKLISKEPELLLAEDDVLLIGGGLKENRYCKYKMSDLARDFASDFTVLGTKESVWKTDSRSAAIGVSKFFGITVSGSQKLIPQTTLKQHILDKWTANPLRANPAIFNHYLGVQLSHCTGNARRVSLRELMISDPIWKVLERQTPGWTSTPWGSSFKRALFDYDREAIFQVWKDFASDRANFAGLLCCLLELLDCTGLVEGEKFHAAMLYENEEYALPIHTDINDWSIPLRDTHITAAYVIIDEICLNCEVPNHSTSSCHIQNAYTVLQTQFATERPRGASRGNEIYILRPDGRRLQQVDGGGSDIFLLTSASLSSNFLNLFDKPRDCLEVRDQFRRSTTNTVYIRASNRSFHGMHKPKSNVALEHIASLEEERRGSGPNTRQSIHNESPQTQPAAPSESSPRYQEICPPWYLESPQRFTTSALPTLNHMAEPSQPRSPQASTSAPLSSRPHIPSGVDGSLIMSDVYGQSVYPNRPGGHSILDDVANHELWDDDDGLNQRF